MGSLFTKEEEKGKGGECSQCTWEMIEDTRVVYNTLNDLTSYLLVIDCRPASDFDHSHMDLAVSATTLEDMLSHAKGSPYTTVIVYSSDEESLQKGRLLDKFVSVMAQYRREQGADPLRVLCMKDYTLFKKSYPFHGTDSVDYEEGRLYPSQIDDNIFLSNFGVASSAKVLQRLGITHVLNCTKDCPFAGDVKEKADSASALLAAMSDQSSLLVKGNENAESISEGDTHGDIMQPLVRMRVAVVDEADQQIHEYFDEAIDFVDNALNDANHRVVIHCKHGQSRSATVAAAYLMHRHKWSVDTALAHLKSCRPKVCPNEGFVSQLHSFVERNCLRIQQS